MTVYKRLFLAVTLAILLGACGLFENQTSPLSDTCYDPPAEASRAGSAQLALGAADAAYVPGRLLVSYRSVRRKETHNGFQRAVRVDPIGPTAGKTPSALEVYRATAAEVRRDHGLEPLSLGTAATAAEALSKTLELGGTELVRVPTGRSVAELATALSADPRVRYAEPDYYLYPLGLPPSAGVEEPRAPLPDTLTGTLTGTLPNDPFLSEQWHLLDFGLPQAWALETGQDNVVLAVLDSGVDLGHEDLQGRILPGCDLYNQDNDPSPGSPAQLGANQRHGTHVAGIALASGDNAVGVAGVAYTGVKLLPVKVFDDSGRDALRTATSVVARAIRWSAGLSVKGMNRNPYPANIINLSLGGEGTVQTLNDAVADARRAGTLVVAASGNSENQNTIYAPANAPGVIAVGSVDQNMQRSSFSNFSRTGRSIDLVAPGGMGWSSCGAIFSTLSPAFEGATESAYGCERGTSMASPFVAGVAALIWSQNPGLTRAEVEERLLASARYTDAMNRAEYGAGVLCADRALGAPTLCGQ